MTGIQDHTREDFKQLMHRAADIISNLYHDLDVKKVYQSKSRNDVFELFNEGLPKEATNFETVLDKVERDVIPNSTLHFSPNFYPWVTSNATQASIVGDMIASALNINATTWLNASAASEIEQKVIQWIIEFI